MPGASLHTFTTHPTGAGGYNGMLYLFLNRLSKSRFDILRKSAKAEEVYFEAKSFVNLKLKFVQYQVKIIWDVGMEYYVSPILQ